MAKKEYARIPLLPDEEIKAWWKSLDGDQKRQDKLREAVKIGIQVLEKKKGLVALEKQEMYDAIETLLRQGIIQSGVEKKEEQPKQEKRKASRDLLRRGRQSIKESIQ